MDKSFEKIFAQLRADGEKSVINLDDRILIVDFLNTYLRSFTGSPAMNSDGEHCGGITGFLYSLGMAIRTCNATRVIIVADGEDSTTHRKKLYPEYKEKRHMKMNLNRAYDFNTLEEENVAIKKEMVRLIEYLECLPVQFVSLQGTEADDAIAYIAKTYFNKPENKITIMSSDKDFLQLIDDRIQVWSPTKKKLYTRNSMFEEYGVYPENFVNVRALCGDDSDNIDGIEGLGLKTVIKMVPIVAEDRLISINEIIDYSIKKDEEKKHKVQSYNRIANNKDKILLNEKLMNLREPIITDIAKLKLNDILNEKIRTIKKTELYIMYMRDKLSSAMPDINNWLLQHFTLINNLVLDKYKFFEEK
jgi:DNA polymerase-1